ncbi:ABC transporter substrate-binding protein [Haloterrigena alkaliphila]|uniref:ABC transporter substrate-binding protein n=1 Tax=Haloterrigena alkaliphila TaxID=2816475 RepID=A0A8A2VJJ8_9EURY|nr:ABC transporter substrate-binding protein [Haloterrigena alkaliphila]QSW98368.1 ABC transporter substrate-binding protein [Haloterrigena alkaliphila]
MKCNPTDPTDGVDRRSVLAAGAAGLSLSLSGCVESVQSVVNGDGNEHMSLSIVTVPGDAGPETVQIARHLERNLKEIGINASLTMRSPADFLEKVLIDHDFDIYVGRHPADYDPDFLYEALHSTYATESGWQNPFGFDRWSFDSLLEDQRRADGEDRRRDIAEVLDGIANEKPFQPICRPDEVRIARTDRFEGWDETLFPTRSAYLGLDPVSDTDRLNALVTDARASQNLNPLSATTRDRGTVVDLLYDSLGTVVDGEVTAWLAESWEFEPASDESDDSPGTTATVTLREDCRFHDDEPNTPRTVTANDVFFTYRFLADTALGQAQHPSPPPRYRGHTSAVEDVEIVDERTLRFTFDASTEVAKRAFTVPIFPRHIWREELENRIDDLDEFTAPQGRWGLVTSNSVPPIGSGPYRLAEREERSHVLLERFDDHFTLREDAEADHLRAPLAEELRFTVDTGSASSINRIESGNGDVTASMLASSTIRGIPDDSDIERLDSPSWTFFHVGFNTRRPPCSNLHFRRAVCQAIDTQWLVDEVFHGHAQPLATPLTDEWTPDDLAWDGEDPVTPFAGSDGTLNVEAARAAFESAGYPIDDEGRVLRKY